MPYDLKNYPPNWPTISKFVRFYRAQNKCEFCGIFNRAIQPDTGAVVILTAAHLCHDSHCNNLDHIIALCQRCHLAHDKIQHLRTKFNIKYFYQLDLFNFKPVFFHEANL